MAWRSSGSTHDDMVDCLKRNGLISSKTIEKGFRAVDRKFFVPPGNKNYAYSDQPLREGQIHISAPHIYCSVLEALELEENSSISFLNIGSGTGYLSCIIAEILGPKSLNYGIEIYENNVKHSNQSIQNWKNSRKENLNTQKLHLDIIHGNVFNISSSQGESMAGFDRIYIGASLSKSRLAKITKLLSPGGILVGPVDDELVKVIRIGSFPRQVATNSSSLREEKNNPSSFGSEFTQQILSNVRFAPLVSNPRIETIIPARIWSLSSQKYFPETYKQATDQILLCSKSMIVQPHPPLKTKEERINLAAMLPKVLWMEILSFTHRKWFDSEESEVSYTKKRLMEEQNNASRAHAARLEAERRCLLAEKERDVYRLLARRWQSRLNLVLQQQRHILATSTRGSASTSSDGATDVERASIFGIDTMLGMETADEEEDNDIFFMGASNAFNETDDGEEDEEEEEMDEDEINEDEMNINDDDEMDEPAEELVDTDDEVDNYESVPSADRRSADVSARNDNNSVVMEDMDNDTMMEDGISSSSKETSGIVIQVNSRNQIRTVSMGDEDM